MNGSLRQQRGMGALSWLFILAVAGVSITIGFKLGPIYLEYYTVRSSMQKLKTEPDIARWGPGKIWRAFDDQLYVNEVRRIKKEHVKIKKSPDKVKVDLKYEVRRHMMFNVDAVLTFADSMEIGLH